MLLKAFAAGVLLPICGLAAEAPLPELRIEPSTGGSVFFVRNIFTQPLTAYLIELVNYPGSSYSLLQDEITGEPIAPGAEKRISVSNMIVGAVPDYVKIRAALYADGSSSGIPEKIASLLDHRRSTLETTRELIRRIQTAQSGGSGKSAVVADLNAWTGSMQPAGGASRNSPDALRQAAAKAKVTATIKSLDTESVEEVLARLRSAERALAESKPAL